MEQSAYEALMIGVYVFVFIIALTAGILLMSNVIDMVNYANDQAIVGMNGTLAETVGIVEERVYTGAQLITYYEQERKLLGGTEEQEQQEPKYDFKVKLTENSDEISLNNFIKGQVVNDYIQSTFILRYKGEQDGKDAYVFVKQQAESEEG